MFDRFSFTHRAIAGRRVRLGYALTSRSGASVAFEETFELPETLVPTVPPDDPAVSRALLGLHLAAGTSYWKTFIPRELTMNGAALSGDDARFFDAIYTQGLGEFFYRNELDPTGRVTFPTASGAEPAPATVRSAEGPSLVLWGGGKDSVVTHEILAAAGEPHELLSIGRPEWESLRRSAAVAARPLHLVSRRLDPKLRELNASGAWNGHVPVSAILAFAGTLCALLCGRPALLASNEASASVGNASWHGIDVNHQWSKSLEFERSFRSWGRLHFDRGPEYVSLLRPLTELRIMKAFTTHPGYFDTVTSCNANFSQTGPARRRFCLGCAKCVFVSLMARPWLSDAAFHALFGGDALADPGNQTFIEELIGLKGQKPFECVGTPDETLAALHLSRTRGHILPHGIMTAFAAVVARREVDLDALAKQALERLPDHELSASRMAQLDDYLDRH